MFPFKNDEPLFCVKICFWPIVIGLVVFAPASIFMPEPPLQGMISPYWWIWSLSVFGFLLLSATLRLIGGDDAKSNGLSALTYLIAPLLIGIGIGASIGSFF